MPRNVRCVLSCMTAGLLVAALASQAQAKPNYGGDCSGCHGGARDAMDVAGAGGVGGPLSLPVFSVNPGETAQITFDMVNGGSKNAVAVSGLGDPGVTNLQTLLATVDTGSLWTDYGDYFATGVKSTPTGSYTLNVAVDPAAVPDYYQLSGTAAGTTGGLWSQVQGFYLQVVAPQEVPEPGTLALLLAGSCGLAAVMLRRRQAS